MTITRADIHPYIKVLVERWEWLIVENVGTYSLVIAWARQCHGLLSIFTDDPDDEGNACLKSTSPLTAEEMVRLKQFLLEPRLMLHDEYAFNALCHLLDMGDEYKERADALKELEREVGGR